MVGLVLRWFLLRSRSLVMLLAMFFVAMAMWGCGGTHAPVQSPHDCIDALYEDGKDGQPLRLPDTSHVLPDAFAPLPDGDEVPWFLDGPGATEIRSRKYLIADAPTPHSSYFLNTFPKCTPHPDWATITALEREAHDAGLDVGRQYGEKLGRIETGIAMLQAWPHYGITIKRILNNKDEREGLLRGAAKDLNELPELPEYTQDNLARAAKAGFETGYQEGIDRAHFRAWLVNIGVDVYFMACGNIAGALETAGAKILDKAIMRIRNMPIFVPGTVIGPGFFMKIPRLPPAGSSRVLLRELLAAGKTPLEGEVPHHIVAHTDWRAERAREILAKFGIELDTAENGVFLPQNTKSINPKGKAVHQTVHTNDYYEKVFNALDKANSKAEVIKELGKLALQLEQGGLK
jgi:hypothetical protein